MNDAKTTVTTEQLDETAKGCKKWPDETEFNDEIS